MRLGWLTAWWDQIRKKAPSDPWNEDPDILRERERQHREGVVDAYAARLAREALALRREQQFWQRNPPHHD